MADFSMPNDYKELIAELKEEWNACDRLISDKIAINLGMLAEKHHVPLAEDCCSEMVGIMQTIDCAIDAIEQLSTKCRQLETERDAAVDDIPTACGYCKWFRDCGEVGCFCPKPCTNISGVNTMWEWRGVRDEVSE